MGKCIVCGASEEEVAKLHYFPANLERSKIWQERLGLQFTGDSLRNHRICNRHFERGMYVDYVNHKLSKTGVPIPWLQEPSSSQVEIYPHMQQSISVVDKERKDTPSPEVMTDCQQPSTSTSTPQRKRKIFRIENLTLADATPRKLKLIRIIQKKEDHLRKIKKICKKRGQDLKSLSNLADSTVVRKLFQDMPSVTADFMISQIRSFRAKGSKGRRWTFDEKVLALSIFKRSPRCYRLLRSFVALPSKKTLLTLLKKVPFQPGINPHIFKHIDDNLPPGLDRCCTLIFDEMDIKENIQYEAGQDRIVGFAHFQDGHCNLPANKVLVFMLVGILPTKKWKQPVAFYFSHNGCKAEMLQKYMFEVLGAARNIAKVDVVTTICDMGVHNVKCYKNLGVTIEKPYFCYDDEKIHVMYDPPHLLKCTYSLFRKHNILIPTTIGEIQGETLEARFGDIKFAYELDKKNPYVFRTLHKLKDSHVKPMMQYAMKVSVAAQTLSHTVAAYLYSLISSGILESRGIATATFVKEVDTLFDSFNGSSFGAPDGKELRCMIKEDSSPHFAYWEKAFKTIKNWRFKRLTKSGGIKVSKPPSQIGWLLSINGIRGIWNVLQSKGFSCLRPRSMNQDPLENLFGAVRSGCGCSDNPTAFQFVASLKTQILNGLINYKPSGTNCEEDEHIGLSNLKSFLLVEEEEGKESDSGSDPLPVQVFSSEENIESVASAIAADVVFGNHNIFSVSYVSGFIIKGILKQLDNCILCKSELTSDSSDLHNIYVSNKEWTDNKERLIYPSINSTVIVGKAVTVLESFLNECAFFPKVCLEAQNVLRNKVDFTCFTCVHHKEIISKIIVKSVAKIGIPWWCKRKNQEFQKLRKDKRELKRKIKKFSH